MNMANNKLSAEQQRHLSRVIPILRGLLAERTESEDRPYQPIILKYRKDKPEGKHPLLEITSTDDIAKDLDQYRQKQNTSPDVIGIEDLGFVQHDPGNVDSNLPLKNTVALVTGSAGAIGYGVCKGLLENGAYLAASDLPSERFDAFIDDLKQMAPDRVIGIPLDVTDADSIEKALRTVTFEWGGIDLLVHNAGIAMASHLIDIDVEEFDRLEKVNVKGTLLTLQAVSEHFIRQATGGDIVIMSSKTVPSPGAGFGGYSATKAACHQLGRIASLELAQYGVRVNMVAPDAVFSEGKYQSGLWAKVGPGRMKARGLDEKGLQDYYRDRNLLKTRVTGRHVANAVLFFATRQTPTTGATIPVDGGLPAATPR